MYLIKHKNKIIMYYEFNVILKFINIRISTDVFSYIFNEILVINYIV